MNLIVRNFMLSCVVGFIAPTLAFATISEPQEPTQPKQIFELSYVDAEGAIGFALAERGAGKKVSAAINGRKTQALFSYNSPISVEIRGLQFDKSTSRWNASLMFISDGSVISAIPVSGRYDEMIEAPVLRRQVRPGDVIQEADIEMRDFALTRTSSDTIADMASLIGKSPGRTISPGRPIREQEIMKPALIKKNDIVQMEYRSPGVSITTTAQAMEDGSKGSAISVRNLSSKKIVRAVVENERTVTITGIGERYAAAN